jgi:hypothetical protein
LALPLCFFSEAGVARIGHPDLDRAHPLGAEPVAVAFDPPGV